MIDAFWSIWFSKISDRGEKGFPDYIMSFIFEQSTESTSLFQWVSGSSSEHYGRIKKCFMDQMFMTHFEILIQSQFLSISTFHHSISYYNLQFINFCKMIKYIFN